MKIRAGASAGSHRETGLGQTDCFFVSRDKGTHHFPLEDVLGDVSRLRGVPLDGVGVGLVSRLSYDHLDRTATT